MRWLRWLRWLGWLGWLRWCWCSSCLVVSSYQLKILYRGYSHSSAEVKAPTLQLFMPPWRLIFKDQRSFFSLIFLFMGANDVRKAGTAEFGWIINWSWERDAPEWIFQWARKNLWLTRDTAACLKGWGRNRVHYAVHPPRTPRAQHIQLVCDLSYVVAAGGDLRWHFFGVKSAAPPRWRKLSIVVWRLCIIDDELGAKKIRSGTRGKNNILSSVQSFICQILTSCLY